MLSTIFISLAQEHEHKEDEAKKAEKAHLKGATAPEAVTAGANN